MKPARVKPAINIDVVNQVDARVGTIESVSEVEGSNKLVRLKVDFGDHKRTIFAGMKQEREDTTKVEGRQALFIVNLEPRKMMGEISEGVLFDVGYDDGLQPAFLTPEHPVPNGTRAG